MTSLDPCPETGSFRFVRGLFRAAAIAEAVSWIGLLTAMAINYPLNGSPMGVTIWGWVHGTIWIVFFVACLMAATRFRWSWWVAIVGVLSSLLPFLAVPFERWMLTSERLLARGSSASLRVGADR